MKKKHVFLLFSLLLLLVAACKKDPDPTIPDPNATPETSITFTCKDTLPLANVLVGIASQATDRDNGVFLKSGSTDGFGKIKFTGLDPQTFYYSASRTTTSGIQERKGSLLLDQDVKKQVTVTF